MHETEDLFAILTDNNTSIEIEVVEHEDAAIIAFAEVEVRGYAFPRRTGRVFSRAR